MTTASEPNPKHRQRAEVMFQHGNDAALKNNFDYAIDMYRNALKLDPENLIYRQALRGVERRKFDNNPAKVSRLVVTRNQPIRMRARSAISKQKFAEAIEICEEAFIHNPWDVAAAQEAAEAAEHLEQYPLMRWLLESVHAIAETDVAYLKHLARAYELNEEWDKAIGCWERVKAVSPTDDQARRQIKSLSASATITRSGLGEAIQRSSDGHAGPEIKTTQEVEDLKRQALTPEDRLRKEIDEDPRHVGSYLELADLLKHGNRLDEAERVLARGLKAVPEDEVLQSAHADMQISRLQRAIGVWGKKAQETPDDPAVVAKLEQLRGMLDDYELKEFGRRVKRHPDDMNLRFQFGVRLAKVGRHDEAIAEFQQARSSASLKAQALQHAGASFEAKGLPKLAERNYQEALKFIEEDDENTRKALHYRLGRVAESIGDLKAAEEHYNEVAASDYLYQDVADRLATLNRNRDL